MMAMQLCHSKYCKLVMAIDRWAILGRPSKTEANFQVKRKKKRCLAINISKNTPNAKTL